jgi:putative alpha-1,2-mannosidase
MATAVVGMWLGGGTLAGAATPTPAADAFAAVDPFIGTGGEGHTFPGAVVPFGMVQLSPDTQIKPRKEAYGWAAGYRYDDHTIVGFSHTHFSGTGHSDLGDVLLMPIAGDVHLERGDVDHPGSGYTSRFSHSGEIAQPATTPSPSTTTACAPNSPPARASACIATRFRRASPRTC